MMRAPSSRRTLLWVIGALLLATSAAAALRGSADASSADAEYFVGQINALRSSVGLAPLAVDGNMASLAADHTTQMIGAGQLFHASDLAAGVSGPWARLGENVGRGGNPSVVWNTFVSSPGHHANLTNPAFTHVGVAVAYDGSGQLWTTHRFVSRPGGGGAAIFQAPPPAVATPAAPVAAAPRRPNPQVNAPPPAPQPAPPPPPPPPPPLPKPDPARASAVLEMLRASPD